MHEQIIGALESVAKDCEMKPQKNMLIDYIEIQFAIKFAQQAILSRGQITTFRASLFLSLI